MMKTVQIRFAEEELRFIDQQVKEKKYPSRSEAVRDFVRKSRFFQALTDFRELVKKAGISEEELVDLDKSRRKDLFESFFGSSPSRKKSAPAE